MIGVQENGLLLNLVSLQMPEISEELIKDEFVRWWTESYSRPPGTHAIMTHVPFAMHIIQKLKQQEEAEQ